MAQLTEDVNEKNSLRAKLSDVLLRAAGGLTPFLKESGKQLRALLLPYAAIQLRVMAESIFKKV